MVPAEGLEPTLPCENQILSLARLPIPPRRRVTLQERNSGPAPSFWQVQVCNPSQASSPLLLCPGEAKNNLGNCRTQVHSDLIS